MCFPQISRESIFRLLKKVAGCALGAAKQLSDFIHLLVVASFFLFHSQSSVARIDVWLGVAALARV